MCVHAYRCVAKTMQMFVCVCVYVCVCVCEEHLMALGRCRVVCRDVQGRVDR